MRIALFNSYPFHYDFYGFILEFLFSRGIEPEIYTKTEASLGYFTYYEKLFGKKLKLFPIESFDSTQFDYVVLITDYDPEYKKSWVTKRLIIIEHYGFRKQFLDYHKLIQLRKFNRRVPPSPDNTWTLFLFDIMPKRPKPNNPRTTILGIGNNFPTSAAELVDYFPNFEDLDFIFLNRKQPFIPFDNSVWDMYPNVKLIEDVDAEELVNLAYDADWLVFLPKKQDQLWDATSSIFSTGYGVGTPILMVPEWWKTYGYRGIGLLDHVTDIHKPSEKLMEEFNLERKSMFKRRDNVLSNSFDM